MARSRTLRPGFFKNESLAELSPWHRLLFEGLWLQADRRGVLEDRPKRLKAEIFPYDDEITGAVVDAMLWDLAEHRDGFVRRYDSHDGRPCLMVTKFKLHQNPHPDEKENELPAPESGRARSRTQVETQLIEIPRAAISNGSAVADHGGAVFSREHEKKEEGNQEVSNQVSREGESEGKPKRRPSRRVPADFDLTDERLAFADSEGLGAIEARREFAKMRDHKFREPREDWDAVWRNWVRTAVDRKPMGRPSNGTAQTAAARTMRNVEEFLEEEKAR